MNVQKVQKQSKKIRQLVPKLCPHLEESEEDLSFSSEFFSSHGVVGLDDTSEQSMTCGFS